MNTSDVQAQKRRYGIVGNSEGLNHAVDIALQVAKTDSVSYTHLTLPTTSRV